MPLKQAPWIPPAARVSFREASKACVRGARLEIHGGMTQKGGLGFLTAFRNDGCGGLVRVTRAGEGLLWERLGKGMRMAPGVFRLSGVQGLLW